MDFARSDGTHQVRGGSRLPEKSEEKDRGEALNKDGSPMFWDIQVLAVPVKKPIELDEIQDFLEDGSHRQVKLGGAGREMADPPIYPAA